jgi:drug/metabolite transporter (DMT)-like permease
MALLWALVTAMADAIGDVMMGKISKTSNPILASVPLAVVMILLFFIASLFGSSLHFDSASLLYGIPIGILLAIANILFYKAMAIGPMAMVSVTSSLAPLLPLGFDVLTGKAPNAAQATSFALMVAGICLVASRRESTTSTLTKGIRAMSPLPMAIASAVLYGLIDILFELGDTSNMLGLLMVIQIAKLITTIPLAAFVIERNGRERIPVV